MAPDGASGPGRLRGAGRGLALGRGREGALGQASGPLRECGTLVELEPAAVRQPPVPGGARPVLLTHVAGRWITQPNDQQLTAATPQRGYKRSPRGVALEALVPVGADVVD